MLQPERKLSTPTMTSGLPELPKLETLEEDPLQFLWAVSYCDLLMVLMSFFIIFFQMDETSILVEKSQPSLADGVILALKKENLVDTTKYSSPLSPAIAQPVTHNIDMVVKSLSSENIKISQDGITKSITIDFDANLYPPRGYAFPKSERPRLERILHEIKPLSKDLLITFIGHTDETQIAYAKDNIIDSNLILSNLRAARAVEIAFQLGFDPKSVTGQGAAEFSRKTRSLSLKITERKTQ